jgi:cytochrome P450
VISATPAPTPTIREDHPTGGVLGLLPELGRDALGLLTRCSREYGDLVRIRLGLTRAIVVGHPDLVEEVLVTRNADYRKGESTRRLGSLLGNGLLLSEGEFWLRQRRLMQPAFHRQRLQQMVEIMTGASEEMAATWRDGEVRMINLDMQEVALHIVGRALFGRDVAEADLNVIRRSGLVMNEHFRSRLYSLLTVVPDTVPTPGNRRYQVAVRGLEEVVLRIIGERRASGQPGEDLLGMLLSARDDQGRGMTDRQLRDEVLTLLLAGHETTALALTWAWVLLAGRPEAEARLHASVDAGQLAYAENVVTETLRLYPTAWAISREALRDTHIGGQPVARGTMVLIVPWSIHRDPRFFEEPDAFRPERWADGLMDRLPRFAYLPFGGGQRVCIGSAFAQQEATLVLSTLARRFSLSLANPTVPIEPYPVVTLRTREDVPMRLVSRNPTRLTADTV